MLKIYNTLSRKKESFKPLGTDYIRVYDCGPTVYYYAHIGNLWRFLVSDLVRRTLEYNSYKVKQVMNITDVGHLTDEDLAADTGADKIEAAAKKEKKTPQQIAEFYTQSFLEDIRKVNIQRPTVMPKATEHIPQMIRLVKILEEKGYTYQAGNYLCFDISRFPDYGKLSGKDLDSLRVGERLEPIPEKRNPFDFALWIRDPEHLQKWESPWGVGYPGWHLECSAMSMEYLGEQLDIHSGGEDNIFPHHENEIAQSEAATGKEFVNYWIHVRHNLVHGKKMSKSLGNVILLQNIIDRGYDPLAYRYLCLTVHYRSQFNFTWESLGAAQKGLNRLTEFVLELADSAGIILDDFEKTGNFPPELKDYRSQFIEHLNNDFNLPKALAVVWDSVSGYRNGTLSVKSQQILSLLADFDRVLGLKLIRGRKKTQIGKHIAGLLKEREKARLKGDFARADLIRSKINELGYCVEDTPQGPEIKQV